LHQVILAPLMGLPSKRFIAAIGADGADTEIGVAVVVGVAVLVVHVLAPERRLAVLFDHQPTGPVTGGLGLELLWGALILAVFLGVIAGLAHSVLIPTAVLAGFIARSS
jgi:hypothetical protein